MLNSTSQPLFNPKCTYTFHSRENVEGILNSHPMLKNDPYLEEKGVTAVIQRLAVSFFAGRTLPGNMAERHFELMQNDFQNRQDGFTGQALTMRVDDALIRFVNNAYLAPLVLACVSGQTNT